jgi:hypothetical protein
MSKKNYVLHPDEEYLYIHPLMAKLLKIAIETHQQRDMVHVEGIKFEPNKDNVTVVFTPQRLASLYALFIEAGRLYQYLKPEEKPFLSHHEKINSND